MTDSRHTEMELEAYILHKKDFLSKNICEGITKECNSDGFSWDTHDYYSQRGDNYSRGAKELKVSSQPTSYGEVIMGKLWEFLHEYTSTKGNGVWNDWEGFSPLRLNKYTKGTNMVRHCDHIHSMFPGEIKGVPILTLLIYVSEAKKGGGLFICDNKVEFSPGDLIAFPSSFLYPHQVTKIMEGERLSLISWVY
jgi:hypothetical protein